MHNKTLAAQLYAEFKEFFPENAVEYFVSYYDYYQPEAYVPRQDLYIEKETEINEEIERPASGCDHIHRIAQGCHCGGIRIRYLRFRQPGGLQQRGNEIAEGGDLPAQCTAAPTGGITLHTKRY